MDNVAFVEQHWTGVSRVMNDLARAMEQSRR